MTKKTWIKLGYIIKTGNGTGTEMTTAKVGNETKKEVHLHLTV